MSLFRLAAAAALVFGLATEAEGQAIVRRIQSEGVIRCGGVPRVGLLGADDKGVERGLYVDLCRAIGAALLGAAVRVEIHEYDSDVAFDALRDGGDELAFLTAAEILAANLTRIVAPGPTVYYDTTQVMVAQSSPARSLSDLAGKSICFLQTDSAERHLNAWFSAHKLDFIHMAYREDLEMYDTYNVQVCKGLAAETTTLAGVRLNGGVNHLQSRILPDTLAVFPVMAAVNVSDPQWEAIVTWAVHSLVRADTPTAEWESGGVDGLPIPGKIFGLADDWQKRVVASGTYDDLYRRNLGDGSPLKLPLGVNALWRDGGLFAPPYVE